MKKSGKKWLGILLAASIITATVFPMQGTAAEGIDRGVKNEAQQKEENAAQGNVPEPTVSANILPMAEDSLVMPFAYDINQPVIESFEFEENGQTLTKDDTLHFKMVAYDADGDIKSATVRIGAKFGFDNARTVTLQKEEGNLYTGTLSCRGYEGYEGSYHISTIKLEDAANNYVEWPIKENGEYLYNFTINNPRKLFVSDFQMQKNSSNADGKLGIGDTVTYTAHVECEGMELKSTVYMYLNTVNSDRWRSDRVSMKYDAETKTLTGTYRIKDSTYPAEWILSSISTEAGNKSYRFYPDEMEPDKNLKFTVSHDNYDAEKPIIESITIDKNGEMVKVGEKITIKVKVNEKSPEDSMQVRFNQQTGEGSEYAYLYLNKSTMEYTGSINITSDTYPGKWVLDYLYLSDENDNLTSLSDFRENWEITHPWYFMVGPEGYLGDRIKPVIESLTIDKNGQWVCPGDTVTVTVKVDEENPSDTAYARFYPQASNVSGFRNVSLKYNADTKEYIGTISIINDTYPCEWILKEVCISDIKGNCTYLYNFQPGLNSTWPWYYRVKTDDTYREDIQNATFTVYGLMLQENGSFSYVPYIDNKIMKIGRRDSLEGLGLCPPLPAEGVNIKFLDGRNDREINGDTELFFENASNLSYYFRAVYDKNCINVLLTYVSKDGGIKTVFAPQFVDKGATYGDMMDSLVLPEDVDEEFLAGYQLEGQDETALAKDMSYVGVKAKYDGCMVAWHVKYLDENGNEVSKVISKTYKKGTVINDAAAALEGPEAPKGLEFERWALPGIDGKEPLLHELDNLDVIAVYKGKTTAEVSYTYRGEDGKITSGSRLMALDGENLSYSAALEKAKEVLKELKHLEGLVLSDWVRPVGGVDIAGYKKMSLQAQYSNCTVILKYPQNLCEYVVVEKGSGYTLPVENEEYTDIVWEGYGKGETVIITEDKEFLVAEAKRKDGAVEEPSGGKLPEEEIEKIIESIKQSGSGETIHVDMRKATIVPKEVLEAIKGKEVNIVLDMGAYRWSIGGNKVVADQLKDVDLEVFVGTDDIPPTIVDSLAEGKPATQITLTHNGDFGFQADLTVNLGRENSGCIGNLYYYDSAGKLVFQSAGEIGADGDITLSFSHASEYVVIMEKESAGSGNVQEGGNHTFDTSHNGQEIISIAKTEDNIVPGANIEKNSDFGKPKSPKTGE